ncbi:unnamed protein product [Mytilus edulis]|uniref:Uncharacterized protein n=1 Tax=Mytilus edulis TaxID=6550 RepID=A0A8S3UKJ7_MYTED|nr:unnamed protein product [Mytilus edulis]
MEAYSFGYQRVSIDKRYGKPPVIYRGPDVIETFIDALLEEEREIDFLNESLASLTKNLAQEGEKHFVFLRKSFPNPEHFSMLLRKGVFPYDYVDEESKLEERSLPSKENFYSRLSEEHISEEDFHFANKVWEKMNVKTWVNEGEDIEKLKNNIGSLTPNSNEGYILEVDLEYPPALHDEHSDFPLAPERQTIRTEDLSPYSHSFLYHIQTEDMYDDMMEYQDMFDTSEYDEAHMLHSNHNKKVLGKFKDETKGVPISEFVGLRAKMYSYAFEGGEKHTAKGITKSASRSLKHEMYKHCLLEKNVYRTRMNTIRSDNHKIFAQTMIKKSLVPFDDKRWILDDGITTRAYGHKNNTNI